MKIVVRFDLSSYNISYHFSIVVIVSEKVVVTYGRHDKSVRASCFAIWVSNLINRFTVGGKIAKHTINNEQGNIEPPFS